MATLRGTFWPQFALLLVLGGAGASAGCASVPKEAVELSHAVGQDIAAIHVSYVELIRTHFDGLRRQTVEFVDNVWTPTFLEDFIKRGQLVESAKAADPKLVLEGVQDWAEAAVARIEQRKATLLKPIDDDERALLAAVDEAFAKLLRANAALSAHLSSLRDVQEVQDEALKALHVKELRDKVNAGLVSASDRASQALEELKKAERMGH